MPWTWFYIQVSEETVGLKIQLDFYKDTITGCFCFFCKFFKDVGAKSSVLNKEDIELEFSVAE